MKKIKSCLQVASAVICMGLMAPAMTAEVDLYPTGPAEDAAFVRFVNGGFDAMRIVATGSKSVVELNAHNRSTRFLAVKAGARITGEVSAGPLRKDIALQVKPSEFVTVVGVSGPGDELSIVTLREQPEDFSAAKASVAFYNMNAECAQATIQVGGRKVALFEGVSKDDMARRLINPVKLSVQLLCNGQATGKQLDMGGLVAGERYSIFLAPGSPDERFFFVMDAVAN